MATTNFFQRLLSNLCPKIQPSISSSSQNSSANITLQKPLLVQKSQHKKQCPICLTSYSPKDMTMTFQCQHQYCHACLNGHIGQKLKAFAQILCPDENCKKPLDKACSFFKSLPPQDIKKYNKIQKLHFVNNDSYLKLCPIEGCEGIMSFIKGETIFCPTCGLIFCEECLNPIHDGECEENQVQFLQKNMQYRRCSQSRHVLERTHGCNHMTCVCKYEFCYVCGEKWSSSHMSCKVGQVNRQIERERQMARQRQEQQQRHRQQQRQMQRNQLMAERYGSVDDNGMRDVLKISEEMYFQQFQNDQILDEDIRLAMQISIASMQQEGMKMNEELPESGQIIYDYEDYEEDHQEIKGKTKMSKHQT